MELEKICEECKGSGRIEYCGYSSIDTKKCYTCEGIGSILTEAGEAVLSLVEKYLKPRGGLVRK